MEENHPLDLNAQPASGPFETRALRAKEKHESLFEAFAWLYIFFREQIFRDDTARLTRALWSAEGPPDGMEMMELGCGPGFYSCRFASRFPRILVTGIDQSPRQLSWAADKARREGLANCHFEIGNVLALPHADQSFDVLLASRLFTVVARSEEAIAEMYRVLRYGGRCVIAEPRYAFWASIPLRAMWFIAGLLGNRNRYSEPRRAGVLNAAEFRKLLSTQPWRSLRTWQEGRYQYALCEKD